MRPGIPTARDELLSGMNLAEADIPGLQAADRVKGILSTAPTRG